MITIDPLFTRVDTHDDHHQNRGRWDLPWRWWSPSKLLPCGTGILYTALIWSAKDFVLFVHSGTQQVSEIKSRMFI